MELALLISAPLMILGILTGLIVALFQSLTQLQEQTLAFAPKIVAVFLGLFFFGPWMLRRLVDFTAYLLTGFPGWLR
jgi:flagellar biosynthetic protein FliQ